jgi:hypothetical protein
VLAHGDGRLSEAEAARHAAVVRAALAPFGEVSPLAADHAAAAPELCDATGVGAEADAAGELCQRVDELLTLAQEGDRDEVSAAADAVIEAAVALLAEVVRGGELPTPFREDGPKTRPGARASH